MTTTQAGPYKALWIDDAWRVIGPNMGRDCPDKRSAELLAIDHNATFASGLAAAGRGEDVPCPDCNGTGESGQHYGHTAKGPCGMCNGTGKDVLAHPQPASERVRELVEAAKNMAEAMEDLGDAMRSRAADFDGDNRKVCELLNYYAPRKNSGVVQRFRNAIDALSATGGKGGEG